MSYYYLIASLPDLSLDMESQKIDFEGVIDLIRRNLQPSDEAQFRYLIYPNDNRNLLHTLFEKHKDFQRVAHISPSSLSEQELKGYRTSRVTFPAYMSEFFQDHEDQLSTMTMREIEDDLWDLFYQEIESQVPFIAKYYQFERRLKALFSTYNYTSFDFLKRPDIEEAVLNQVGKEKSIPANWLRAHPYIEDIAAAISGNQPTQIEKLMDRIKWDYLEDEKGIFNKEQVFTYTLRLLMVQRWQNLRPEKGATRFSEIQDHIKSNVRPLQYSMK